jgi:hypothetical protein
MSGEFVVLAGLQFGEQLPNGLLHLGQFLNESRTTFLRMLE